MAPTGSPKGQEIPKSGAVPPNKQDENPGAREQEMARTPNPVKRFLKVLGPGLIVGASDDDPSGIGTYSAAGASIGYSILWTSLFTFPMMASVQYICAKVGMVTGMGLAGVLKLHYPRQILYPVVIALMIGNTINLGADIGAIAAGVNLVLPLPAVELVLPITLLMMGLLVVGSYRLISNVFKWLCLALFAYVAAAFLAKPDWAQVLQGTFVPKITLDGKHLALLVAILGTTISPYLFFWQSSQEVEEKVAIGQKTLRQRKGTTDDELKYAGWDIDVGMLFSNLVSYFIILAAAATLNAAGQTDVNSAADAARALGPLAGDWATILFALGMIGSGLLAVPVLAGSSAYAISEAFGWRLGLEQKATRAWQFYLVIFVSMVVGAEINYLGINPIDALVWSAVINGVLAVPLLVLIMLIANNRGVMGSRVNGIWSNLLGWAATLAMAAAALGLFLTWGK
jgi:NRAMP (natural resistance-associated macrophage protein)-like metal ion transporter